MTTTIVKDSIVGDGWIQQVQAQVPVQRLIDPKTGNFNGDIITGPVRLAFDNLFTLPTKKPGQSGEPKFGTSILFPPNVDFSIISEEYYKALGQFFPEYYVAGANGAAGQYHGLHSPFRDQAEKMRFGGFTPGCTFMNCTSKFKPPLVDSRMNPIVDPSKVYPGVWAICVINAYPYGKNPPQPKKGVAFGLQSVMIIGDDTKFGGGAPDAKQQFAGVSVAAPISRPDMANMPVGAPAGITHGAPVTIPQTHFTPQVGFTQPQGAGVVTAAAQPTGQYLGTQTGGTVYNAPMTSHTDDDDMSFMQ